jgi:DNA-binding PucR family transcriptional regulator
VRQAATIRARELEIDLGGPLRVIHFAADGMTEFDSSQVAPGTSELRLRTILNAFERAFLGQGVLRLMAGRGGRLVALIAVKSDKKIRSILKSIEDDIGREIRGLKMFWGLSAPCDRVGKLQAAHGEAAVALLTARKFRDGKNLALYEELGIVGVLMKVRSDADLSKFVEDTLGRVISHGGKRHDVLIRTLRAYFDCNCQQQAVAKKLLVHEKTVRYRLTQFETLTELDLNSHEDRMLAHLALEMYTTILDRNEEVDGTGGLTGC